MSREPEQMGEFIANLPVNQEKPTADELEIINALFTSESTTVKTTINEFKDSGIIAVIIIIVFLPQFDSFLRKTFPILEKSPIFLLVAKALIVSVSFWIVKYFALAKKN
jgi:hypothetical protein